MMNMEETSLSNVLDSNSMRQILGNLPVKCLMKFRCVSKSWESLTYDPSFIKLHQSKSHPQLFIMMYKNSSIQVYTPKHDFQGGEALYKLTIPWSQVVLLKPINGLFCFVDILNNLSCVYNLGTRQVTPWVSIPIPPQTAGSLVTKIPFYGFGFDPSTGKHKILCIWDVTRFGREVEHIVQVFTLGENEWRTIDELPPVKPFGEAVYANGSIYRRNCGIKFSKPPDVEAILAFDVGTEKFRVIPIPDVIISSHRNPKIDWRAEYLLEVDGHIAIIDRLDKNVVKLWRSDDDYRLETEVTWMGQTIELPFECSIGERLYFHAVQGTRQIIIKPWEARDFVTLHIYDIDTNTFRDIKIFDVSPSRRPFIYGMFTTPETLLPVLNKEKIAGAS